MKNTPKIIACFVAAFMCFASLCFAVGCESELDELKANQYWDHDRGDKVCHITDPDMMMVVKDKWWGEQPSRGVGWTPYYECSWIDEHGEPKSKWFHLHEVEAYKLHETDHEND